MPERELVYRISVAGQSEAKAEIRSIVQEANRAAADEAKATKLMVDTVLRERQRASVGVRRVADADAAHEQRTNAFLQREAARRFKELTREHEKAERDKTKAAEKEARQREADAKRTGARMVAEINREVKEFTKAEQQKRKEAEETAKFVLRAQENTSKQIMAQRRRDQAQADRDARQFARDRAFEDRRLLKGIATGISEGVGSTLRYSYGLAARGVRDVASGMGMQRGWDLADITAERALLSRTMRSVAIEARTAGSGFDFDEAGAKRKVANVARASGFTQTELTSAIDAYSEKGSGATGVRDLDKIAMQARAMGADPATVARLRANLEAKGMDAAGVDQFMARMHFVGKTGVFRASDMAAQSEMMLASFGPDIKRGGNQFLGFANEVRKSTGSGAMARTAFDAALDTIDKKRDKIAGLGVDVNDESKTKVDLILDTIAAAGGDRSKLAKIFDPSRSGKAITTLVDTFNQAGGGAAGREAMTKLLGGDASLQNASIGEMQKDANAALAESSTQTAIKMEELRQKLAEKLLPVLDKLVDKLLKVVDSKLFSKGLDFVGEHPYAAALLGSAAMGYGPTVMRYAGNAAARWAAGRMVNTVPGYAGGGIPGRAGGVLGSIANAVTGGAGGGTPVFVTNWPAGGSGGFGGAGGAGAGAGGGGLLSGGAESVAGIGGASGAAIIGTMLAAALSVAAVAVIGDAVMNKKSTGPGADVGREATKEDLDELKAAREEKARKERGMEDILAYGGNFVETDEGAAARVRKAKTRDRMRQDRWMLEWLDKGSVGHTEGYSSPVTAEIAGGDGSRKNVAYGKHGKLGSDDDGQAMGDFRDKLKLATANLDELARKSKAAANATPRYKGPVFVE